MLLHFNQATRRYEFSEADARMVPEFSDLYDRFGPDAVQYLVLWAKPLGPFSGIQDPAAKDKQVCRAVNRQPAGPGKLPEATLYRDPLFKKAVTAFEDLHLGQDADILEIVTLRAMHRVLLEQLRDQTTGEKVLTDADLKANESRFKQLKMIRDQLADLTGKIQQLASGQADDSLFRWDKNQDDHDES